MKRTNRLLVQGKVMIKVLGTLQSRRRKKLSDTIGLAHGDKNSVRDVQEACPPAFEPVQLVGGKHLLLPCS
jgi:hypothetical protein